MSLIKWQINADIYSFRKIESAWGNELKAMSGVLGATGHGDVRLWSQTMRSLRSVHRHNFGLRTIALFYEALSIMPEFQYA